MSGIAGVVRSIATPKLAVLGGGALATGAVVAHATSNDQKLLGYDRSFYAGIAGGVVGAVALKAGLKRLPVGAVVGRMPLAGKLSALQGAAMSGGVPAKVGFGAGSFAAAAAIGTVPGLLLLSATRGDQKLLGQGHDFWTGAVWGLAGVALAVSVIPLSNVAKLGPLALGWVAGDFISLGIDSALNGTKHS